MPTPAVIDTHAHCGIMDRNPPHAIEDYARDLVDTDIQGAAFFSPVAEIYDRYDPFFEDSPQWRSRRRDSNAYLLSLNPRDLTVTVLVLIGVACAMLTRQLERLAQDFEKQGGFTERLYRVRTAKRRRKQ
ncbi:MAG: four helix bundle suffix domain-containing protein [Desulfovermiculus sp.]|nr:four helix bundle suffix domain-containing protein [Desulfovermiculus sp.]